MEDSHMMEKGEKREETEKIKETSDTKMKMMAFLEKKSRTNQKKGEDQDRNQDILTSYNTRNDDWDSLMSSLCFRLSCVTTRMASSSISLYEFQMEMVNL